MTSADELADLLRELNTTTKLAYTETEAAETLSISARLLRIKREQGEVVAHFINTKPIYLATDLIAFVVASPTLSPRDRATA